MDQLQENLKHEVKRKKGKTNLGESIGGGYLGPKISPFLYAPSACALMGRYQDAIECKALFKGLLNHSSLKRPCGTCLKSNGVHPTFHNHTSISDHPLHQIE